MRTGKMLCRHSHAGQPLLCIPYNTGVFKITLSRSVWIMLASAVGITYTGEFLSDHVLGHSLAMDMVLGFGEGMGTFAAVMTIGLWLVALINYVTDR